MSNILRKTIICLFLVVAFLSTTFSSALSITSVDYSLMGEKSQLQITLNENYTIVIPNEISNSLNNAVLELKNAIKNICNLDLDIKKEKDISSYTNTICIDKVGNIERPTFIEVEDGYKYIVEDKYIAICGANEVGSRNGVYDFIETKLGCMFLTDTDTYYPKENEINIEKDNKLVKPATSWRDVYAYETIQNSWAAKLKLNGIDFEKELTGNKKPIEEMQYAGWGLWCHDCFYYLSPEDYYDTHPEYFSEHLGKRVTEQYGRKTYLCLSNPEVYEIVRDSLAKKIEENPDVLYWDFSGNDNPYIKGCECDTCKKLDKEAGGTGMGTLLPFLNKLAQEFPDKYISTLAYLHTLKAPKNIKAESNVVIKLCAMPGDQAGTYLEGDTDGAKEFKEQIEKWSQICDKIVVWDYVVNFTHLLLPFPNFEVQAANQQFYEENGVIGVFHQASREKGGEMAYLRAYVLSRLMWEGSQMDVNACIEKYVKAYYGEASSYILQYMKLCREELDKSGNELGLYDEWPNHYKGYLSLENVKKYQDLISKAYKAVEGDEVLENRVNLVRLNIEYANVIQPKISEEERENSLKFINDGCDKNNITMVCEWISLEDFNNGQLEQYLHNYNAYLYKPLIITLEVLVAALIVGGIVFLIIKKVKSKKIKMKE